MRVKVSLDDVCYKTKPVGKEPGIISKRLGDRPVEADLEWIAHRVGVEGYTFCTAWFDGKRKEEYFSQTQLFGLDFDENITYKEAASRAEMCNLPISFSYKTFSWTEEHEKFRLVFCHVVPITEMGLAKMMLEMLMKIFPEADKACSDTSRMFYGGKGMIKEPDDATFRADELVEAFQRYSYTNDERNFARNNKKFAYKHNLALRGNMLDVRTYKCGTSEVLPTPESDAKETSSIIYTIELDHSASKIEFYGGGQVGQSYLTDMCDRSEKSGSSCDLPIAQLRNIKENQIKSRCLLYREFSEGEIKSHNERFMLATNLLYVRGMKNRFLQWIKKYYDSRDKWEFTWRYISDMKYKPQRCDTMCPYAGRCIHDGSLYLTLGGRKRIERLNPDEEYSSLEECYSELEKAFEDAMMAPGKAIHLVSGQTGLGKTQVYIEYLRRITTPVVIAVPTVELEQEIEERMGDIAIRSISLKELVMPKELSERVEELYLRGLYKEVRTELDSYMKKLPDGIEKDRYQQYLSFSEELENPQKHIIITHMRLLQMGEYERSKIGKFPIIIDEDILLTIFRNTKSVSTDDIQKALDNRLLPDAVEKDMKKLLGMSDGSYMKSSNTKDGTYVSEKMLNSIGISGNINELMSAGAYYKEGNQVDYFVPLTLPDSKIIVLSATLNAFLYKKYFRKRTVVEHKVPLARYTGSLRQYFCYSMSRRCMSELAKQIGGAERLKKILDGIAEGTEYKISFKQCEAELECIKHYGNAAGYDGLKGKSGMIIGTPHLKESSYKLIACYFGIDMKDKDKNTEIRRQKVEYGNYRFIMMSYKQELLQEIQLYIISSELEQCIGRSRLLRENATVYVFSDFPCEQAEFFENDYIKEYLMAAE